MGILEQIAADLAEVKERLNALEGGKASGGKASGKASGKAADKDKAKDDAAEVEKPDFTAEDLRQKFLAVQSKHGDDVAKSLIGELGYSKLAELIADTENWQKAMDAATAKLEEEPEGDDNGGL